MLHMLSNCEMSATKCCKYTFRCYGIEPSKRSTTF